VSASTPLAVFADNAASTAEFYRNHAGTFAAGSLGYVLNLAEAEKYARLAERYATIAGRSDD